MLAVHAQALQGRARRDGAGRRGVATGHPPIDISDAWRHVVVKQLAEEYRASPGVVKTRRPVVARRTKATIDAALHFNLHHGVGLRYGVSDGENARQEQILRCSHTERWQQSCHGGAWMGRRLSSVVGYG